MKKALTIAPWVIIGILLLFFLFSKDKQHDTHAGDFKEIVANDDTLKAHEAKSAKVVDSLNKTITGLKSENKRLLTGQTATQRKLNAKTAELNQYIEQVREINTDTGVFGHMLDSLKEKAENLTYLIVQYEAFADSINTVNDSIRIGYEEKIKIMDHRYWQLKTAYDALINQWSNLFEKNRSLMKDAKRQKLKTKVLGVLGAVGAVLLLVK